MVETNSKKGWWKRDLMSQSIRSEVSFCDDEAFPSAHISIQRECVYDNYDCGQLEERLEHFIREDKNEGSVIYVARPDVVWLSTRRPFVRKKESLLGLLEEDEGQPRRVPLHLQVWSSRRNSIDPDQSVSCCTASPHREWKRTRLSYVATPPSLDQESKGEIGAPKARFVDWMDLREAEPNFSSAATVAHFVRRLFGSSHHTSPWVNTDDTLMRDCVMLVLSEAPEVLRKFRVSDVSPDWSLFSVVHMDIPTNFSVMDNGFTEERDPADVLVFRRLSLRTMISSVHPVSGELSQEGCLWETHKVPMQGEEREEDATVRFVHRLVAPPYIDPFSEFPCLESLLSHLTVLQAEAARIPQWTAWPEQQHYQTKGDNGSAPWHVFPLCHCFPADTLENLQWISTTASFVPQTVQLLKQCLGPALRTALFSRLDPEAVLEAHTGWEDLANHVYRVHLPLIVPPGGLCGTWVDGCIEGHEVGRYLAFDDSKIHRAFNYSSEDRVVLILDLARPEDLPRGTATGGHSDELDQFIAQMEIPN